MKLKVLLPSEVFIEKEVDKVVAEAANGAFCLLPRHVDFVAALVPGILSFTGGAEGEQFVAIDEGILVKCGPEVLVSTRKAVRGPDLGSLRKRVEDIPLLTDTFVESFSKKHGKKITKISKYIREKLQSYDWPGNVRELQNVIERAVITTPGRSLKLQGSLINTVKTDNSNNRLDMTLLEVEKRHIVEILEHCSWKISGVDGAASLLGLHPNTLRSKMQKLGIKRATDSDPEINKVEI